MEEKTNLTNQEQQNKTVEGNEETGKVVTQTTNQNEGTTEIDVKAEAQKLADGMLAKKMKGMPSKEELRAFKEWQESQKTAEQKQIEKDLEYQKVLQKSTELEYENKTFKSGVRSDDVDYVVYKVSKMEGEFEENLSKFLEANPKYLAKEEREETPSTTGIQVSKLTTKKSGVNDILKAKHPDLYK